MQDKWRTANDEHIASKYPVVHTNSGHATCCGSLIALRKISQERQRAEHAAERN